MNLGGIVLSDDIYREGINGNARVDARMVLSRANTPLHWAQPAGPQAFDLIGEGDRGLLTGAQLAGLIALASVPGARYDLTYNSEIIPVYFRVWEPPVIDHNPLGPKEVMSSTAIYRNIRIKLMEA